MFMFSSSWTFLPDLLSRTVELDFARAMSVINMFSQISIFREK